MRIASDEVAKAGSLDCVAVRTMSVSQNDILKAEANLRSREELLARAAGQAKREVEALRQTLAEKEALLSAQADRISELSQLVAATQVSGGDASLAQQETEQWLREESAAKSSQITDLRAYVDRQAKIHKDVEQEQATQISLLKDQLEASERERKRAQGTLAHTRGLLTTAESRNAVCRADRDEAESLLEAKRAEIDRLHEQLLAARAAQGRRSGQYDRPAMSPLPSARSHRLLNTTPTAAKGLPSLARARGAPPAAVLNYICGIWASALVTLSAFSLAAEHMRREVLLLRSQIRELTTQSHASRQHMLHAHQGPAPRSLTDSASSSMHATVDYPKAYPTSPFTQPGVSNASQSPRTPLCTAGGGSAAAACSVAASAALAPPSPSAAVPSLPLASLRGNAMASPTMSPMMSYSLFLGERALGPTHLEADAPSSTTTCLSQSGGTRRVRSREGGVSASASSPHLAQFTSHALREDSGPTSARSWAPSRRSEDTRSMDTARHPRAQHDNVRTPRGDDGMRMPASPLRVASWDVGASASHDHITVSPRHQSSHVRLAHAPGDAHQVAHVSQQQPSSILPWTTCSRSLGMVTAGGECVEDREWHTWSPAMSCSTAYSAQAHLSTFARCASQPPKPSAATYGVLAYPVGGHTPKPIADRDRTAAGEASGEAGQATLQQGRVTKGPGKRGRRSAPLKVLGRLSVGVGSVVAAAAMAGNHASPLQARGGRSSRDVVPEQDADVPVSPSEAAKAWDGDENLTPFG